MSDLELVMQPARYWRIKLYGYGAEVVFGNSSKEEVEYWESEQARIDTKCSNDEEPLDHYIWENIDSDIDFSAVPEQYRREGSWHDQDDLAHTHGVDCTHAYISIEEVENTEWNSVAVRELIDAVSLYDFIISNSAKVESFEFYTEAEHVFCGTSEEKGIFFDGVIETQGPLDLFKLTFKTTEYPNGFTLVESVLYDDVDISNEGGDTNGKSMDIGFIEL